MRSMYSCSVVSSRFLGRPFGFGILIGARLLLLYRSTNFLICALVNPYFSAMNRCVMPCSFISKTCRMMSFPKCFPIIKNLLPFYPTTGGLFSQCPFSGVQSKGQPFSLYSITQSRPILSVTFRLLPEKNGYIRPDLRVM